MQKKSVKLITVLVSVTLLWSIISGCGASETNTGDSSTTASSDTATESADNTPLTITHFYNYSWFDDNYANTTIGQELQKRANVKLVLTKSPTDDGQKLNMMIASNDLPDMITTERTDLNVGKLISGGLVSPVSDMIDQYAPEILKQCEPEYFKYFKASDGKQYFFTNFMVTDYCIQQPDYPSVFGGTGVNVIRSDVYEAIGKPDMSTPDGFFNALKMIKEKFPKLNPYYFGPNNANMDFFKAAEFQGSVFPATQFGVKIYEVAGDKLTSGVRSQKFLDFIKFMNKLYVNDLLSSESFVDSADIANAKIAKGNFSVISTTQSTIPESKQIQDNSSAKWVFLPYFQGGEYFKDGSGWTATMISKKVANPEKLMKFISYCTGEEGRELIDWGIEGTHWDWQTVNNLKRPVFVPEVEKARQEDWAKFTKDNGFATYFAFSDSYIHNRPYQSVTETDYDKNIKTLYKPIEKVDPFLGLMNPDGGTPEGNILLKISELSKTYYPKMVMAKDEASCIAAYNEFIKKSDELGLSKVEAIWTDKYNQSK